MVEDRHLEPQQHYGLQISADSQYLDVYRLLAVFGGSRIVAEHAASNPRGTLYEIVQRFERSEAARLLLNVAVVSRSVLDSGWLPPIDGNKIRLGGDVVGWLEERSGAAREDLHFREACNKIIHTVDVKFSYATAEPVSFRYLNPDVRLAGSKGEHQWSASVNVLVFAECAYNVL